MHIWLLPMVQALQARETLIRLSSCLYQFNLIRQLPILSRAVAVRSSPVYQLLCSRQQGRVSDSAPFTGFITSYRIFNNNFVASNSNSTANSLRSNPTFMRCAAIAPSGAVNTVASMTHSMAGR